MKYVSINGGTIRRNAVLGTSEPPIRVANSPNDAKPTYARALAILDKKGNVVARLVYSPRKRRLRCGARLVLECANVRVVR
jgi:hypothetical protein